jgi:hypothetical protein
MKIITRIQITVRHNDEYHSAEKDVREPARKALVDAVKKPQEWTLQNEITHSGMTFMSFERQKNETTTARGDQPRQRRE